jgi:quercetin dioxygenase-like cupin family protein
VTLIRATDAEILAKSGVTLLADTEDTGGVLTSHRSVFRAGTDGAPPHFHAKASELFYVLSGSLSVLVDETVTTLHSGDLLVVPPKVPHAFAAGPDQDAEVLFVLTQATPRFDYYRLLERVYRGEVDPRELSETQDLYDNHYAESPAWSASRHKRLLDA